MLAKELTLFPQPKGLRAAINRGINKFFTPGWENYDSISDHPEQTRIIFQDNPLVAVHPGFLEYWPLVDKSKINHQAYSKYLKGIRQTVNKALREKRQVFVVTPNKYLEKTLEIFDHKKELILIPTLENTTCVDDFILGISSEQFFEAMGSSINKAEVCGEQGRLCVTEIAEKLARNGVEVTLLNEVIVA